jgi:hypothetical protein
MNIYSISSPRNNAFATFVFPVAPRALCVTLRWLIAGEHGYHGEHYTNYSISLFDKINER